MSKRKFKYFIKRQMVKLRVQRRLMEYENVTQKYTRRRIRTF